MKQPPDHSLDDGVSIRPADDDGETTHEKSIHQGFGHRGAIGGRPVQIRFTMNAAAKIWLNGAATD